MSNSTEPDKGSQTIADDNALWNTHDGLSFSLSLGSAPAGQEEVGTQALVLQLIDLNELANIEDTDTPRMFKPALKQAQENITAMLTITYNA